MVSEVAKCQTPVRSEYHPLSHSCIQLPDKTALWYIALCTSKLLRLSLDKAQFWFLSFVLAGLPAYFEHRNYDYIWWYYEALYVDTVLHAFQWKVVSSRSSQWDLSRVHQSQQCCQRLFFHQELGNGFVPLQMISLGGRMLNVVRQTSKKVTDPVGSPALHWYDKIIFKPDRYVEWKVWQKFGEILQTGFGCLPPQL